MQIIIRTDGRPINVSGPLLPFSWLNNLKVVAKKRKGQFIVTAKDVAKSIREKDSLAGHIAQFFEEFKKTETLVFNSDAVQPL